MHDIEPYYNWRHIYTAEEDEKSPFFGVEHSEFSFSNLVYNYYIHPQWDEFGSRTLYLKILFTDYDQGYVIIEMIGEWNDAIENDIMQFKREVAEPLMEHNVDKFILITENVFNFHSSDNLYYEEWEDEVNGTGGWIVVLNMLPHAQQELKTAKIQKHLLLMDIPNWRVYKPHHLFQKIDNTIIPKIE